MQILIEHGADVNAQNESHSTPLHLASSSVSTTASFLIHRRTDVGGQDDTNSWVFKSDQPIAKAETVRVLLKHGADVTMQDEAYSTPLHLASSRGSTETVRLLLQHGADVAAQDGNNRTPLHLASSWVSAPAVSLVFQQRVDVKGRLMATTGDMMMRSPTRRPTLCDY